MGTATATALVIAALATHARADECTGISQRGERFAQCFDVGNRLSVTASSVGLGIAAGVRHEITFDDDPDLEWKMQHTLVEASHSAFDGAFEGAFYRGRYLRHSRDGHLVIPLGGTPKKLFLPFDIGALFEAGSIAWKPMDPEFKIGVVRVAPLVDFARARDYRRIFAIGPSMHWDMNVDRSFQAVTTQTVAPFTEALANAHVESSDGLWVADLRAEAGTAWRSERGWSAEARASASVERIVISIRDKPVALTAGVQYDSLRAETVARLGARFVVLDRTHPRVSLHPLQPKRAIPIVAPPPAVPEVPPEPPTLDLEPHTPEPDPPLPLEEAVQTVLLGI
ncbi:hypothetical protein BH11MYX1_BH11MYX1_03330 [soil metagenome]